MKRVFLFLLAAVFLVCTGCVAVNDAQMNENTGTASGDRFDGAVYFDAVILEVNGASLLVECTASESNAVSAGSQVSFSAAGLYSDTGEAMPNKGDNIRVYYDGSVMETYPLQLGTVHAVVTSDGTVYSN